MRTLATVTGVVLAVALGACGSEAPKESAQRKITIRNETHEGLLKLSEPMRHLGLMRAVRDTGNRCKRVEAGAHQQDHRGMAMWVARCDDRREWAIFIAPNADVQVRKCEEMAQLKLPLCRPLPEGSGTPSKGS